MNILLTITGFQEPYAIGLVGQEEQPGLWVPKTHRYEKPADERASYHTARRS
jgi:hypothetical protein